MRNSFVSNEQGKELRKILDLQVFQLVKLGNFSYEEVMRMTKPTRNRMHELLREQYTEEARAIEKLLSASGKI